MKSPIVKHLLFYVRLSSGDLTLAELEDDRICILRNNQLVDGWTWHVSDMEKAVEEFQKQKVRLMSE
jgi:hypothetical protein